MARPSPYPAELRERAVRMVAEVRPNYPTEWAAMKAVAAKLGIGAGDILLVVENSATWWSLVHSLPDNHRLGYVAWGLGGTFRASVNTLAAKHRIAEIRYFGDLDLSGIRIPHAASKTASDRGLPSVQPTECLYGALLELGRTRGAKEKGIEAGEASALAEWMPGPYRAKTVGLLVAGQRLAQEWVGYRYLTRDTAWHADLV